MRFLALFFTFFILQVSLGARIRRDEPATTQSTVLEDLTKAGSNILESISKQFEDIKNSPTTGEIQDSLTKTTQDIMAKATDILKALQAQMSSTANAETTKTRRKREEAQANIFDDISKRASTIVQDVSKQFEDLRAAKDATEVQTILKQNTDDFITKATDIAKGLQEQFVAATGDTKTVLGQAVAKINESIEDLKQKHPEATARAEEINQNLKKGLETLLTEADKVAKNIADNSKGIQEDLTKITQKAYDQVVQTSKTVTDQIHEFANKQQSS